MESSECRAELQFALSAVGADVNYDYHAAMPALNITHAAATNDILATRLIFVDDKFLRVIDFAGELPLHVDLKLRAPGILDLFHPLLIGFDESLSLLRADGSILATSQKNSGVGFFVDQRDTYQYGWDFFELPSDTIHGFQWHITPNLAPGVQLPETIGLEFHVASSGPIVVVPEPSIVVLLLVVAGSLFMAGRQRPIPFGRGS